MTPPPTNDNGDTLGVTGPGGWGLNMRGGMGIALVIAAALGWIIFYFASITAAEHRGIVREMRHMTCVLSLLPEERTRLREDLRKNMGQAQAVLVGWCPWIISPVNE